MSKHFILFFCLTFIFSSCNKISDIATDLRNDYNHSDALNTTTKIIIEANATNSALELPPIKE